DETVTEPGVRAHHRLDAKSHERIESPYAALRDLAGCEFLQGIAQMGDRVLVDRAHLRQRSGGVVETLRRMEWCVGARVVQHGVAVVAGARRRAPGRPRRRRIEITPRRPSPA